MKLKEWSSPSRNGSEAGGSGSDISLADPVVDDNKKVTHYSDDELPQSPEESPDEEGHASKLLKKKKKKHHDGFLFGLSHVIRILRQLLTATRTFQGTKAKHREEDLDFC